MPGLQIYAPLERAMVRLADLALSPISWLRRAPSAPPGRPERVLLMRLERIGDLLMVLDAIGEARALWPGANIDLAVGSWNLPLARLIPGIAAIQGADVPWLARDGTGHRWAELLRRARAWRRLRYDLVINFEPDIRSNLLAWMTGAPRRYGYWTGGGGAFLTDAIEYEPTAHVAANASHLVRRAADLTGAATMARESPAAPTLVPPAAAIARATRVVDGTPRPLVGVHVSGGRESKQWHLDRFASVARRVAEARGATIVLTGSAADRPMVRSVADQLADVRVIDVSGQLDLAELAALMARLDLLITGDTGPMHIASAMDTPLVALFGPSDPRRYGPRSTRQRVLRVDLPCSPCGQVRLPPERCRGHVPDCMDGLQVELVAGAALDLLDQPPAGAPTVTAR